MFFFANGVSLLPTACAPHPEPAAHVYPAWLGQAVGLSITVGVVYPMPPKRSMEQPIYGYAISEHTQYVLFAAGKHFPDRKENLVAIRAVEALL